MQNKLISSTTVCAVEWLLNKYVRQYVNACHRTRNQSVSGRLHCEISGKRNQQGSPSHRNGHAVQQKQKDRGADRTAVNQLFDVERDDQDDGQDAGQHVVHDVPRKR
jgi:hypothetical protein